MGTYGVKMTAPGCVCRGYRFKPAPAVNECEKADCARCGFHFAENPLDCLSYYPDFDASECWLVYGDGDMDEDNVDSRITCTKITFLRKLDKFDFLIACVKYIHEHPRRQLHRLVCRDVGEVGQRGNNRFVLVVGEHPRAMGSQAGDVLCLLERREDGQDMLGLFVIGAEGFQPGVWYGADGLPLGTKKGDGGEADV